MATDPLAEELQVYINEIEANRDPDDSEIEAYARMKNRVAQKQAALDAKFEREFNSLKTNYEGMCREIANHDAAIEWKYGQMIAQMVAAKIKGMRQRSVKTLFGTVGYRKTAENVIRRIREGRDEVLLAWSQDYCPAAVSTTTTIKIVKGELPADCPHIYDETVPATDTFYWKPAKEKNDA